MFAKIGLVHETVETLIARSGISRNNFHTDLEPSHSGTDCRDRSREFVANYLRRLRQMVAALIHLNIRTTCQGD
jgi:hypothetical protein